MNVEKQPSLGRALWNLIGALGDLLVRLLPVVLMGWAIWAFFAGQHESVHHLVVVAFLILIANLVLSMRKIVERIEKQHRETRVIKVSDPQEDMLKELRRLQQGGGFG